MNIIIFRDNHQEPLFSELESELKKDEGSSLVYHTKLKEVAEFIKEHENALILFSPASIKEVKILYQFLKKFKSYIKKDLAKIVCSYKYEDKKYVNKIKQGGVSQFLNPLMKINDLVKNLKELSQSLKSSNIDSKKGIHFINPLDHKDDCWIITKKENAGFFLRAYLVKLLGPGPTQFNWVERELKNKESKIRAWSMKITHQEYLHLFPTAGEWIFTSDQKAPFFDNKLSQWVFSGSTMSLYLKDGEKLYKRFESNEGNLNVCKNSTFATSRKESIVQSIEDPHRMSFEADKENGNLEGEGSEADQLKDGNLEGEGGAADEIDGTLEGNGVEADKINKHYKNKNPLNTSNNDSSEEEEMDSLDDYDDDFETDEDFHNENDEDDMLGDQMFDQESSDENPLSGKNSSDKIDKYYRNNEGQEADESENTPPNDMLGGKASNGRPLAGKGGSDKINKNYEGGLGKNLGEEDDPPDDMLDNDGKKGSGPLSGKSNSENGGEGTDLPDDMLGEPRKGGAPLTGKGSTDKLNKNYDGEIGGNQVDKEGSLNDMPGESSRSSAPLAGKGGTDQIDKNYGSNGTDGSNKDDSQSSSEGVDDPFGKDGSSDEEEYDDSQENYTQSWKKKAPNVPTYERDDTEEEAAKTVDYGSENIANLEMNNSEDNLDTLDIESGEMKCEVYRLANPNSGRFNCQFEDFFEENLTLKSMQVPDFEPDEELGITISFSYQGQESILDLNGVFVYEEIDEDTEEVFLQFNLKNINKREVDNFMEFYQERQKNISKFLNKSRAE